MRGQPIAAVRGARGITRARAVSLLIVLLTATSAAVAQEPVDSKKPHNVPRATSVVTIDGVIDKQAWLDALTLELNYEVRPGENTTPPVRTVVFITYDEGNVLVGRGRQLVQPARGWRLPRSIREPTGRSAQPEITNLVSGSRVQDPSHTAHEKS